jgi:hypothetical protein
VLEIVGTGGAQVASVPRAEANDRGVIEVI